MSPQEAAAAAAAYNARHQPDRIARELEDLRTAPDRRAAETEARRQAIREDVSLRDYDQMNAYREGPEYQPFPREDMYPQDVPYSKDVMTPPGRDAIQPPGPSPAGIMRGGNPIEEITDAVLRKIRMGRAGAAQAAPEEDFTPYWDLPEEDPASYGPRPGSGKSVLDRRQQRPNPWRDQYQGGSFRDALPMGETANPSNFNPMAPKQKSSGVFSDDILGSATNNRTIASPEIRDGRLEMLALEQDQERKTRERMKQQHAMFQQMFPQYFPQA
jgi:hypothetical protein